MDKELHIYQARNRLAERTEKWYQRVSKELGNSFFPNKARPDSDLSKLEKEPLSFKKDPTLCGHLTLPFRSKGVSIDEKTGWWKSDLFLLTYQKIPSTPGFCHTEYFLFMQIKQVIFEKWTFLWLIKKMLSYLRRGSWHLSKKRLLCTLHQRIENQELNCLVKYYRFLKTVWVNLGVKIEFITFGQLVQCVLCSMSKPTWKT